MTLKEISKIELKDNAIRVTYIDSTSMLINNANNIIFDLNYKNQSDIPLNDHCL
jgi:hypothetical protein